MSRPRVLLAENFQLECEALEAVLDQAGFDVVAYAGAGIEVVRLADELQPDVAVLGPRILGMSAIDAGRKLSALKTPVRWVLLSSSPEESHAMAVLLAGGSGFVLRTQTTQELVQALRDALQGRIYVAPGVRGFGYLNRPAAALVS